METNELSKLYLYVYSKLRQNIYRKNIMFSQQKIKVHLIFEEIALQ